MSNKANWKVIYDPIKCTGCKVCVDLCSEKTVQIEDRVENFEFMVCEGTCNGCRKCEEFCPTNAITITEEQDNGNLGKAQSKEVVSYGRVLYTHCKGCNKLMKPFPEVVYQKKLKGQNAVYHEKSLLCPDCRRKVMAKDLRK